MARCNRIQFPPEALKLRRNRMAIPRIGWSEHPFAEEGFDLAKVESETTDDDDDEEPPTQVYVRVIYPGGKQHDVTLDYFASELDYRKYWDECMRLMFPPKEAPRPIWLTLELARDIFQVVMGEDPEIWIWERDLLTAYWSIRDTNAPRSRRRKR